jgi:hypothetical protein
MNVLQLFYKIFKKEKAPLAEVGLNYWFSIAPEAGLEPATL